MGRALKCRKSGFEICGLTVLPLFPPLDRIMDTLTLRGTLEGIIFRIMDGWMNGGAVE
jgi:hypothetical protein